MTTTTHTLITEKVPCASLTPYPGNPRRGDVSAIAESLKTHGQYKPVLVQRSTGRVLAGNHTMRAAQSIGWTELDAIYLDVDDDQAARIVLIDNRLTDPEFAGYSQEDLAAMLMTLDDLSGSGYSAADLAQLSHELPPDFPAVDPDESPRTTEITCPECGATFQR